MNFSALLALFIRSVREETRLRSTYWTRGGLVLLVLLQLAVVHMQQGWAGAPGLQLFGWILYFDVLFIGLAGLSYFSSAITEEKEEGTLGLLRMTDLSPLAILLGKSTSRLLGALLLLIAQLPFTLLAVTMGGVAPQQIFAAYVALGAFVFFLANVALLFSVVARRTAVAALLTGLTMVAFYLAPGMVSWLVRVAWRSGFAAAPQPEGALLFVLEKWQGASVFEQLGKITGGGSGGAIVSWQTVSNLVLGLLAFALAWASFARFADRSDESAPGRALVSRRAPGWFSAGRAWRCALLWKDFHFISGGLSSLLLKFAVCAGLTALSFNTFWGSTRPSWTEIGWWMFGWIGFFLACDLAFAASRIFRLEQKERTLSSLAQLPIPMRRLAWEKVWAAVLAAGPQWLFLLGAVVLVMPDVWEWFRSAAQTFTTTATAAGGATTTIQQSMRWIIIGGVVSTVAGAILLLHLVAWLSLRIKWGALPLAFALWFVGIQIGMSVAMLSFGGGGALPVLITVQLALAGALHVNIGARLAQLAAED